MPARKKLVLVLDASDSMAEPCRGATRFEVGLEQARKQCEDFLESPVVLAAFNDALKEPWLTFRTGREASFRWETDVRAYLRGLPRGGSRIWDSLCSLLDLVAASADPGEQLTAVLVTDGKDTLSETFTDEFRVRDFLKGLRCPLTLNIFYLGHMTEDLAGFEAVAGVTGGRVSGVDEALLPLAWYPARVPVSLPQPLDIRLPVVVIDRSKHGYERGYQTQLGRVVAYLEDLTGLRYYPVVTFIVPGDLIAEVRLRWRYGCRRDEALRLAWTLGSLALDVHHRVLQETKLAPDTCKLHPRCRELGQHGWSPSDNCLAAQGQSCGFTSYLAECLKGCCFSYILGQCERKCTNGPCGDLGVVGHPLGGFELLISHILDVLRSCPCASVWRSTYTNQRAVASEERLLGVTGLQKWLEERFARAGVQPPQFGSDYSEWPMETVLWTWEEMGRELIAYLKTLAKGRVSGGCPRGADVAEWIADRLELLGLYVPPDASDVEHWMAQNGLPRYLSLPGCGKVLVAPDVLGIDNPLSQAVTDRLVESVLVHEHFHAVIHEGVDPGLTPAATGWDAALALDESLAEWAEMHFVRSHAMLLDAVVAHSRRGGYPDWPYAGAAWVEEVFKNRGLDGVRELIRGFRSDPQAAQRKFDEFVASCAPAPWR